jgi:hypothetical protein
MSDTDVVVLVAAVAGIAGLTPRRRHELQETNWPHSAQRPSGYRFNTRRFGTDYERSISVDLPYPQA